MRKPPITVILIACLYLAVGVIGLVFHLMEFKPQHPFQYDIVWVTLVHLIAIVAGAYMLRGSNWARWLALAWIAFHVVLSAFHSLSEFVIHALLCAVLAYFLFRPRVTQYFRAAATPAA